MRVWTIQPFIKLMTVNHHSDYMHESTLDLFCSVESDTFAQEYAMEIEQKAAELELTVDYYMAEFL